MNTDTIEQYLEETRDWVATFCIVSLQTIEAQNNKLTAEGYDILANPYTWKYYLNLNGQYHEADELMYFTSSDTGDTIPLTKDNLEKHPVSRIEYGPGGSLYAGLQATYPKQIDWIDRIFHPVDLDKAVNANDWELLYWDESKVADNEISLMYKIQEWLYSWGQRWHVEAMVVTDPLYLAANIGIMANMLVLQVLAIRQASAKTSEVDQFHLWSYLSDHYSLDRYRNYISDKQALWLYRNVEYLKHHVGKEQTMLDAINNLVRTSGMEAYRIDVANDNTELLEDLIPTPQHLIDIYDEDAVNLGETSRRSIDHGYGLTKDLAIWNTEDLKENIKEGTKYYANSPLRIEKTNMVQMQVNQPVEEEILNPRFVKLTQWFYTAAENKYIQVFDITLQEYGNLTLTTREAAILMLYVQARLTERTLETIPKVVLSFAHKHKKPQQETLEGLLGMELTKRGIATELLKLYPDIPNISTLSNFQEYVDLVIKGYWYQNILAAKENHFSARGKIRAAIKTFYTPVEVSLTGQGVNFHNWLEANGIPYRRLQLPDWIALGEQLLDKVAGIVIDGTGVSQRHRAIVEIMKLLSAYSILYVEGAALNTVQYIEESGVWPDEVSVRRKAAAELPVGTDGFDNRSHRKGFDETTQEDLIVTSAHALNKETFIEIGATVSLTKLNPRTSFIGIGLESLDYFDETE